MLVMSRKASSVNKVTSLVGNSGIQTVGEMVRVATRLLKKYVALIDHQCAVAMDIAISD